MEPDREKILNAVLNGAENSGAILSELYFEQVQEIARLYEGQGVEQDDLVGEGNVAVLLAAKALELCETAQEIDAMVVRMVMEAMERSIEESGGFFDVSERIAERVNELNDRAKELCEVYERKVSVSELAEETGFTREAIRELMRLSGYQIEYIKEED